ncbi:TPA: hypothetical protein P0E24_001979 [Vibrio campbellii]|uniref:hypothetical protein n=1 Tax=Vibrio jasicida TaxID=766224 RepID=UPI0011B0C686|nr:hypothetical protein [Vibrio jasicida]HDM8242908.1 hypothetical protein [Vibrio campbellii]
MKHSYTMILVASDGLTPVASLCRETFVACEANTMTNKLTVVLHHQINMNQYDYGDHVYTVNLDLNRKQYEIFRDWEPCPLHEHANPAEIIVQRS